MDELLVRMVYVITPVSRAERTAPKLLLVAVLILVLGSCGDAPSGEEETGKEETTSTGAGGETTSGNARREGIVPPDVLSATIGFSSSRGSGVSGTAVLADVPGGTRITLDVENLGDQPGTEHTAHVHEGGTCADEREGDSPVVLYSLDPAITEQGGNGSSTTTIPDVTVPQFFSGAPKYADVHAETAGDEEPPSLACADIYTATGGD
jgi:Cu/Zn superoxide dismutase